MYQGAGFFTVGNDGLGEGGFPLVVAENEVHQKTDDDAEHDGPDSAANSEFDAQYPGGENDGQGIDRRSGVKKGRSRADARAHSIDSGKQGQNGAGADGQHRAGDRGHPVGHDLARAGAEIFHHRSLAHENGNAAGDEKGRHQAQQDMLPGIPAGQGKGFGDGAVEAGGSNGQMI